MSLLALLAAQATVPVIPSDLIIIPERVGVEARGVSSLVAPYNAPDYLKMPAIYPNPSGTHPSVVDFGPDQKFNGWRYWMAYTPLYNYTEPEENPVIVVSNDRTTWVEPAGITNPIYDWEGKGSPDWTGSGYNSDTELVWDNDAQMLYCYWRTTRSNSREFLYAKTSPDGIHWSSRIDVLDTGLFTAALSPSIVKGHDGQWRMFTHGIQAPPAVRVAATPFGPWSEPTPLVRTGPASYWHLFVRYEYGQYRMLINGNDKLWPAVSEDGVTFRSGPAVMHQSVQPWEAGQYRACMTHADNGVDYDVWYGNKGSGWQLGYTRIPKKHWWDL